MKPRIAMLVLVAACASHPMPHVAMLPANIVIGTDGAQHYHFVYDGGCFDLDLPVGWTKAKTRSQHITKLFDRSDKSRTLALERVEQPAGTSAHDYAVGFMKWRIGHLNEHEDEAEAVFHHAVNEKQQFEPDRLAPVLLGTAPDTREAQSYAIGFRPILVSQTASNYVHTAIATYYTVTTTVEAQADAIHQYFFVADGNSWFSVVFNARVDDWERYAPVVQTIVSSFRFAHCGATSR